MAKQFIKNKLKPCCYSFDPNGYCGQVDDDGGALYNIYSHPEKHFFWDDVHPTQVGWEAIRASIINGWEPARSHVAEREIKREKRAGELGGAGLSGRNALFCCCYWLRVLLDN